MNLTLAQHMAFAAELRRFRAALLQPHMMHVGKAGSKERRACDALLAKTDSLRNLLDSALCRDHWGQMPAQEMLAAYYGPEEPRDICA